MIIFRKEMANETRQKRKTTEPDEHRAKRSKSSRFTEIPADNAATAGKVKRIFVRNFMCHDALEIVLNENVNFIVGRNGSGKSAILTALVVGLGAKANITSRGTSVKEFIKKGRNSALVEITLVNEGIMAYKPEIYGNAITVSRIIGSGPGYKIKNSQGKVISTKKEELEHITTMMNIQVENPISILNQDVSRTFLVTAGPKEKYELFMKATQLDKIGENYKQAQVRSEESREQLKAHRERESVAKTEIDELENNIRTLESIDNVRAEHDALQNEYYWSKVVSEETKLNRIQMNLEEHKNNVENHTEEIKKTGVRESQITDKIQELKEKIQQLENEAAGGSEAYATARKALAAKKDSHSVKHGQLRSIQHKIHRWQTDIETLRKEIERREIENDKAENEKHYVKAQIQKFEAELKEIEAMLYTKQTDQTHLENEKSRCHQEQRNMKADLAQKDRVISEKRKQLQGLKRDSNSALTVFGPNMPRLLKRIKEEFDRGKFQQMPRGPIGAYIKLKDPAWIPAVESFLGAGSLRSFCVDNAQDAKTLGLIMREVYRNELNPQIIASKFYNKMHNVHGHCTRAPGYYNLLDVMELSDPVIANCLIDQREIECVLLIPTSPEACAMLSDARNVPPNCKRALTQHGDTFFPDPNYRSYGGRPGMRARYLQVSTTEVMKVLEEELLTVEAEQTKIMNDYHAVQQALQHTTMELTKVTQQYSKLRVKQQTVKAELDELRDKCQIDEQNSVDVFKADLQELEKKLQLTVDEEQQLKMTTDNLHEEVKSLQTEVERCKSLAHNLDVQLEPIKQSIREQENELQMIRVNSQYDERRLTEAKIAMQKVTAELEIQKRVTSQAVADAMKRCERMNTQRSPEDIIRMVKELKANIDMIEKQYGSKEALKIKLKEKKKKYNEFVEFAAAIEKSNNKHLKRLEQRRRLYRTMKTQIGIKIQQAFASVLELRKYKGQLTIDHNGRTLVLEVNPEGSAKKTSNDARSLSGGERSYSTVAFILALWDCVELPFYFLDEFDVFMDKVNRRIIMDILLDHTRDHPDKQFAFLTPLDTSNILAEKYLTIHELAPPERTENGSQ